MQEVTEINAEMAIETAKKSPLAVPITIIEVLWIAIKAPREKANRLFSVNSIIQLILTAFLIYKIQTEYALFY